MTCYLQNDLNYDVPEPGTQQPFTLAKDFDGEWDCQWQGDEVVCQNYETTNTEPLPTDDDVVIHDGNPVSNDTDAVKPQDVNMTNVEDATNTGTSPCEPGCTPQPTEFIGLMSDGKGNKITCKCKDGTPGAMQVSQFSCAEKCAYTEAKSAQCNSCPYYNSSYYKKPYYSKSYSSCSSPYYSQAYPTSYYQKYTASQPAKKNQTSKWSGGSNKPNTKPKGGSKPKGGKRR